MAPWQVQMPSQACCSEPNPGSCLLAEAGGFNPEGKAASSDHPRSGGPIAGQVYGAENVHLVL